MQTLLDHWEAIFTVIGVILTFVAPVAARYWWSARKLAEELLRLIDKSPEPNVQFADRAEALGHDRAAAAIAALERSRGDAP